LPRNPDRSTIIKQNIITVAAKPLIMVVDDQPINIQLLKRKLEKENMDVVSAEDGHECLQKVEQNLPDLILLDVMMPDMDGFQVCQELKRREATRAIPVIFITAETTKEGKLQGLESGAVDYLTKPIDLDETLARVQTQLRFQAVIRENLDLQTRLGDARRTAAIGAITQGIAHNLNNLLGVVVGYLDLAKTNLDNPDSARKSLDRVEIAVQRMIEIIKQLTSVSTRSRPPLSPISVSNTIDKAIDRFETEYGSPTSVEVINEAAGAMIDSNVEVFEESMVKLLFNAIESYGREEKNRPITLHVAQAEHGGDAVIKFRIIDRGQGVPEDIRDHIFDAFISSKRTVGVGMGLTVARHSIRNLGGDLEVGDAPGGGTVASFYLPVAKEGSL
jgi:two-component system sensor histidine kinase/response regulator